MNDTMPNLKPKKLALLLLIVSLAISAAIAIVALVVGKFGDLQIRVILTSFSFSAGAVLALSCAVQIERKRFPRFSAIGVILAILAVGLSIYGLWWASPRNETFWKTLFSAWVAAATTSHVCLLLLSRLSRRFIWTLAAAGIVAYVLAAMLLIMIWFEKDSGGFLRGLGVVGVLLTLLTLVIPILHRASALDVDLIVKERLPLTQEEKVFCPQCGFRQTQVSTEITCRRCTTVFVVRILRSAGEGREHE